MPEIDRNLRRMVTVPGVATLAATLTGWAPAWLPGALAYDVARAPRRFPTTRALSFGLAWSWLETAGVAASTALWATGRSDRRDLHYALQRWWADRLVDSLRVLCGLRLQVEGAEVLAPGPVVVCARHASLADSLLPAWLLGRADGMRPRYVLKRELLADPCLDIVGHRVPNHFVDRDPDDSRAELAAIRTLASDMGRADAAVIFPEGGIASDARRIKTKQRLAERDPARAQRLAPLRHLVAPRPNGTHALLEGAPDADLVILGHVGLEGLDRLAAAPGSVPLEQPVRVRLQRFDRADVPAGPAFRDWLDERWLEIDAWIEATDSSAGSPS